jgi:hypothetical protein
MVLQFCEHDVRKWFGSRLFCGGGLCRVDMIYVDRELARKSIDKFCRRTAWGEQVVLSKYGGMRG